MRFTEISMTAKFKDNEKSASYLNLLHCGAKLAVVIKSANHPEGDILFSMKNLDAFLPEIGGASDLIKLFGSWPSFHDAEILEISLKTEGISELKIKPASKNFLVEKKTDLFVVLEITHIDSLELSDFHAQNIIMELIITHSNNLFLITIESSVGISGQIRAKQLSFKILESRGSARI